jgi:hypothetical protein
MKALSRSLRGPNTSETDDVNFLGPHHFTLQEDTPLYWLDNGGPLQRYLLKVDVRAKFRREDTVVCGLTFHSSYSEGALEPESGLWFWAEIRGGAVNYCVGGADLESGFTRVDGGLCQPLEEEGEFLELRDSWKILVQGSYGCIFPKAGSKKKIRLTWTARRPQGHVAFFNYSCTARDSLEVHFRDLSFTLLNTGPALPASLVASKFASFEQSSLAASQQSIAASNKSAGLGGAIDGPRRSHGLTDQLPPVEEKQEQKAAMARTASDPGLQIQYAKPMDLTSAKQPFVPSMNTKAAIDRHDAALRKEKSARRVDQGAVKPTSFSGIPRAAPAVKPARGDILSFVE